MGEPTPPQDQAGIEVHSALASDPQALIQKILREGENSGEAKEAARQRFDQVMSAKEELARRIQSEVPVWYESDFTRGGETKGLSIDPRTFLATDDAIKREINRRAFYQGADGHRASSINLTTAIHVDKDGNEYHVEEIAFGDPNTPRDTSFSGREDYVNLEADVTLLHNNLMGQSEPIQSVRVSDGELKVGSRLPWFRKDADVLDSAARGLGFFLDPGTNLAAVTQYERNDEGRITGIKEIDATKLPSLTPPAQPAPSV